MRASLLLCLMTTIATAQSLTYPETRKDGSIAKFYDVSLFINDEPDQYNNIGSIATGQTKEEREAKAPKTYIGNAKRQWAANNPNPVSTATGLTEEEDNSLPF